MPGEVKQYIEGFRPQLQLTVLAKKAGGIGIERKPAKAEDLLRGHRHGEIG
jgi:hypothetical protein